jgi:hypothetical protein
VQLVLGNATILDAGNIGGFILHIAPGGRSTEGRMRINNLANDLAAVCLLSQSGGSRLVERLVREGLVERAATTAMAEVLMLCSPLLNAPGSIRPRKRISPASGNAF